MKMKKCLLVCLTLFMALCMSGCSEDISEFNIFEYGYNFVEDKIEESKQKSEDAINDMKENAKGAVDEVVDKTIEEIEDNTIAKPNSIKKFFESLFSDCDHDVPAVFNEEENTISCECGKKVVNSKLIDFATTTYNAISDETHTSEISELTSSMSNLCESFSNDLTKEVIKNTKIKLSKKDKKYLETEIEFIDTAHNVLDIASAAINIYDYDNQVDENGQSMKTVNMQISLCKDLTDHIPIYDDYFNVLLENVEKQWEDYAQSNETYFLQYYIAEYVLKVALGEIKDNGINMYDKIGSYATWNQGPSLKALSDAKTDGRLSDEDITILSPYITYRFEHEFANCTNLDFIDTNNISTDTTDTE